MDRANSLDLILDDLTGLVARGPASAPSAEPGRQAA
jgi:hypothetical protein